MGSMPWNRPIGMAALVGLPANIVYRTEFRRVASPIVASRSRSQHERAIQRHGRLSRPSTSFSLRHARKTWMPATIPGSSPGTGMTPKRRFHLVGTRSSDLNGDEDASIFRTISNVHPARYHLCIVIRPATGGNCGRARQRATGEGCRYRACRTRTAAAASGAAAAQESMRRWKWRSGRFRDRSDR